MTKYNFLMDRRQRFGFRKYLGIGLCSVALGSFFIVNDESQQVKADTKDDTQITATTSSSHDSNNVNTNVHSQASEENTSTDQFKSSTQDTVQADTQNANLNSITKNNDTQQSQKTAVDSTNTQVPTQQKQDNNVATESTNTTQKVSAEQSSAKNKNEDTPVNTQNTGTQKAQASDDTSKVDTPVKETGKVLISPTKEDNVTLDAKTSKNTKDLTNVDLDTKSSTYDNYYQFIDDDKNDKSPDISQHHDFSGKAGQNVDLNNITIPQNYELASGQNLPISYTFKDGENDPVYIHLKHKMLDVTDRKDIQDPNAQFVPVYDRTHSTVTRTVIIDNPTIHIEPIIQSANFKRTCIQDLVTQELHYGAWNHDSVTFPEVPLPKVPGYTTMEQVPTDTVHPFEGDYQIKIEYNLIYQTADIFYKDETGNNVALDKIMGKAGTEKNVIYNKVPDHWVIVNYPPETYTFNGIFNPPIIVQVRHKIDDLDNEDRTITRTVNVHYINQPVQTTDQSVTFTRTKQHDEVTDKDILGDWTVKDGSSNFDAVRFNTPAGYKATGTAEAITVNANMPSQIVDIRFEPLDQSTYYQFIDDNQDKNSPDISQHHAINGKTDQSIGLNIKIPDNYTLAAGQTVPTEYDFKAEGNNPIIIHLVHGTRDASGDKDVDAHRTIGRNITETSPLDGKVKLIHQEVTFNRTATQDLITKEITYGNWTPNGGTLGDSTYKATVYEGYYPNQSTVPPLEVNPDSKPEDVHIIYTANGQKTYYRYVDDDIKDVQGQPLQVGKDHEIDGKTNETIDLNIGIPKNYLLAKGQTIPTSYTFKAKPEDNYPIIIHLVHGTRDATNDKNVDVHRTIGRTITEHNPFNDNVKTTRQEVTFNRTATQDLVTGKITYGAWDKDLQYLPEYDAARYPGYTANEPQVANIEVHPGDIPADVDIVFTPDDQMTHYKFVDDMDNQKTVGEAHKLTGKTDQTVHFEAIVPKNYELAKGQTLPTEYKFLPYNNSEILIHLVHQKRDVTHDEGIDSHRTVGRIITETSPIDGKVKTINQSVDFDRTATLDLVTNKISYSEWTPDIYTFNDYTATEYTGYTPNIPYVDYLDVDASSKPKDVHITYTANPQTNYYKFVDDNENGKQVGDNHNFDGKTDQTVDLNIEVPVNYKLADGQTVPTSYTFKVKDNDPIVIHLIHGTRDATHDDNVNVHENVGRVITETNPLTGKDNIVKQSVEFNRTATQDLVTKEITYGKWTPSSNTLGDYTATKFDGYTANIPYINALVVDAESKPKDVHITYTTNAQTNYYKFVDDNENGKQVGENHNFNGKTNQTVSLSIEIPINYKLADGQEVPTSYTFKAKDNLPIIIHLIHGTRDASNDKDIDAHRTIGRVITETNPIDHTIKTINQNVKFDRTATQDLVTKDITYGSWTPESNTLNSYTADKFDGYTANIPHVDELKVSADSKPDNVNIVYTANDQTNYYKFVDDNENGKQVGDNHNFGGKTDQTVDLNIEVPVNYKLADGQTVPTSYTFKAKDNDPIIIHLIHGTRDASHDENVVVHRTVGRVITETNPLTNEKKVTNQSVDFDRTATQDLVTKEITYGNWTPSSNTLGDYTATIFDGYTANIPHVDELKVNADSKPDNVNIVYTANDQTNYYKFVDDNENDKQVGNNHNFDGKTDQKVDLNIEVPENYKLADGQTIPTSYTFKAKDNDPIIIHLIHGTRDASNDKGVDAHRTIGRVITETNPIDKTVKTINQNVKFDRTATQDLVTKEITYDNWTPESNTLNSYTADKFDGYTANIPHVDELKVNADSKPDNVDIVYTANDQTSYYKFVDDNENDKPVGDNHNFGGKTDQTVDLNIEIPVNYKLADNQIVPTSYTFKAKDNDPIIIHLIHSTRDASNDENIDSHRTVGRVITETNPIDGTVKTINQNVKFDRTATQDLVTKEITYGNWMPESNILNSYTADKFDGYTANIPFVTEVTVNADSKPNNVNIIYTANEQTNYYKFVDDNENDKQVGNNHNFDGKTDQKVDLNIEVPENYKLADGQTIPTNYTFKAKDNDPIIIHLIHGTRDASNDKGVDAHRTIGRVITETNPIDKTVKTINQNVKFDRTATQDLVTKDITYGNWTPESNVLESYAADKFDGYTPNIPVVAKITVNADSKPDNVNIVYKADSQTNYYKFVDDNENGKQVGDNHNFDGKTDQTVDLNIEIPINYKLANGQELPTSYTFKAKDNLPIVIHLAHQTQNVSDNKTITRTITTVKPDGTTSEQVQTVTFTRDGVKDLVTTNIKYGNWDADSKTFSSQSVQQIAGYDSYVDNTEAKVVNSQTVTPNDKDIQVTITYKAQDSNNKPTKPTDVPPKPETPQTPPETKDNKPEEKPIPALPDETPKPKPEDVIPDKAEENKEINETHKQKSIKDTDENAPVKGEQNVNGPVKGEQNIPQSINNAPVKATKFTSSHIATDQTAKTSVKVASTSDKQATLPQTGEDNDLALAALGLTLASVGLLGIKKKKDADDAN